MIAEFAVAFLCLAVLGSAALVGGGFFVAQPQLKLLKRISGFCLLLLSAAFALLITLYIQSDFSVANVVQNSHKAKPLLYKITGSWGNHEGSMLLWVWVLALFTAAYAWLASPQPHLAKSHATVLATLGFVLCGFLLFILFTSNPFARIHEPPLQGQDLNPLLQDIGLAIHPPLLYLGYVGFSVVFAIAVGAMVAGETIGTAWAQRVRPWALLAWSFLTMGIGLGSWWAYRELGWGGWWFWDPVENVSLLPWLAGTALIHCLLVLAKRPMLQNWTLLLAIFTFTFSLLGTFLVRSGLLTSVHSFASDPTRGLYVLCFIALITGASLWLYALRYPRPTAPDFEPVSREGGIMVNNLLLVTLCATVLLGIVYPLLMQVFSMPSVSVGAPYYNTVVVPICLPLIAFAGLTPLLAWRQAGWRASRRVLRHACAATGVAALLTALLQWENLSTLLAQPLALVVGVLGLWMLGATIAYALRIYRNNAFNLAHCGMLMAHGGLAIFAVAAAFATAGRVETERGLALGEKFDIGSYEVQLGDLEQEQIDNYLRKRARVFVTKKDNSASFTLEPESRFYQSRGMETAESAINGGLRRDFYTAVATGAILGNSTDTSGRIILRVYIIPAMWWLWAGFLLTSFGGAIAAFGYFRIDLYSSSKGK